VGRTLVGGRSLIARVAGPGQLRLRPDKPVGELRDLTGKLQDDTVLLFDVSLQESEAFLEGALVFIHAGKMKGAGGRARRYDDSDAWRCAARIGG
jgi:hypothetical protein